MSAGSWKSAVPWPVKIAAKLLLSRIPARQSFWRRVDVFRLGYMEQPEYAFHVFRDHWRRSVPDGSRHLVAMEIGPGDTLFSALVAHAFGVRRTHLVDVAPLARRDRRSYQPMIDFLRREGLPVPGLDPNGSLDELLAACGAHYETRGLASLASMPLGSVDFCWSQAVLEHVRKREFADTMRELRRVMAPTGVASHRVDLTDHLSDGLNNLRFSERIWESEWMSSGGFYTNRLRYSELIELFRGAGFAVEILRVERWDALPTPRSKIAPPFRALSDDELRVRAFDVLLRPAGPLA